MISSNLELHEEEIPYVSFRIEIKTAKQIPFFSKQLNSGSNTKSCF